MKISEISLSELLDMLSHNKLILPAFQREFVWKPKQIEDLFDSLMRDFPINTLMLWNLYQDSLVNQPIDFYSFLDEKYEKQMVNDSIGKQKLQSLGDVKAVIDGQQRLTALNIGLRGTYDGKQLCLRIDQKNDDDSYCFKFLDDKQLARRQKNHETWMCVKEIVGASPTIMYDVPKRFHLEGNKETPEIVSRLYATYNNLKIYYFDVQNQQDIDDVIDVFVRCNSGGTALSRGNLLLSVLTMYWANAREQVENIIKDIKALGYTIDKDWVIKAFLMLLDKNLKMSVANISSDVCKSIEGNYELIRNAINRAFESVKYMQLKGEALRSKIAVLPIAYYIFKNNLQNASFNNCSAKSEDFLLMRKYLFCAILNGMFDAASDDKLSGIRGILKKGLSSYPYKELAQKYELFLALSDKRIEELLQIRKSKAFTVLNILYALNGDELSDVVYDVDHLHAVKLCKEQKINVADYDTLPNLQLLEHKLNISKSKQPLVDWDAKYKKTRPNWKLYSLIPENVSLDLSEFAVFIEERKNMLTRMFQQLKV